MTTEELIEVLRGKFLGLNFELVPTKPDSAIKVPVEKIAEIAAFLRDEPNLRFDMLMCLSAVDRKGSFEVVYHIFSMTHGHRSVLKVSVPAETRQVPTVSQIWRTAEWHEREAFDLMGVEFTGHPDLRRILLPDDWEGHPLRKDYKTPDEYRGLKVTYNNLQDPPNRDWE
jgi:NADH-quinone oxidoreductase subunit C